MSSIYAVTLRIATYSEGIKHAPEENSYYGRIWTFLINLLIFVCLDDDMNDDNGININNNIMMLLQKFLLFFYIIYFIYYFFTAL